MSVLEQLDVWLGTQQFKVIVLAMGTAKGDYPGQFTPVVKNIILEQIEGYSNVLHLFSGRSKIGDVRVDIDNQNATLQTDVVSFLEQDKEFWDYTILDPPYGIQTRDKLSSYGKVGSIGGNTAMRMTLKKWAMNHTWRILWLDHCAPMIPFFKRVILWILLPGGFRYLRVLSLLENTLNSPTKRTTLEKFIQ